MQSVVNILSWNIQWGRGADGRVDLERTVAAIRAAGAFDVICLQEVAVNFPGLPGGAREDEPGFFARAFPGHAAVFGAGVDVPDGEGGRAFFGNLVLSNSPVGQVFRHLLPAPADPGLPSMQRTCVEVVVQAPWGALRVMTTHLEYYSELQRQAQVQALWALQAGLATQARLPEKRSEREANATFAAWPRPAAALLCGDFNCEPGSPEHQRMQAAAAVDGVPVWLDAWTIAHPGAAHAPSVGVHGAEWPGRAYCCDFFFVSPELAPRVRAVRVLEDTSASDHQPVVLELG